MKLSGASGSCLNLVDGRIKPIRPIREMIEAVMAFTKSVIRMGYTKLASAPEQRRLAGIDPEPRLGAHLATSRLWYTHHGIYIGSGRVVHYSGLSRYWRSGPVEEVSLPDFVSGHSVWIVDHAEPTYPARDIVGRARSRVGEHDYRLLTNNCEHFCNWCVIGLSHSAQIGRPLEFSSRAIDLGASIVTRIQRMVARQRNPAPRAECVS